MVPFDRGLGGSVSLRPRKNARFITSMFNRSAGLPGLNSFFTKRKRPIKNGPRPASFVHFRHAARGVRRPTMLEAVDPQ